MLSKFSAKKPMTVVVAVIAIIILGVVAFMNISVDLLPSMDLPYVVVYTTYPGASPEKVEAAVTEPLEQVLATTNGLEELSSISSENVSIMIMQFSYSTNMDSAMIEMNSSIDMVEPYFDDMVGAPTLLRINPDMLPVVISSVDYDGMSTDELSVFVQDEIIPSLERLDGVASVTASGLIENTLSITISADKIAAVNEQIAGELDATFDDTERSLNDAASQISAAQDMLNKKEDEFYQSAEQIESGIAQLEAAIAQLPDKSQLEASRQGLEAVIANLDNLIAAAEASGDEDTKAALEQERAGYAANLATVEQTLATLQSLEAQLAQLKDAQSELDANAPEIENQLSEARHQLSEAKAQINNYRCQLASARADALEQADVSNFITAEMVEGILAADNFSMPAGYINVDGENTIVKVGDQFISGEEISSLEIIDMGMENVDVITLGDVTDIEFIDNLGENYAKI
ncbi:MAG: efflux RND transporter permease subunit, partial [Clostridia bacterium]|nr:efflux RND transporter permease subunit [Clostridia bacterium]